MVITLTEACEFEHDDRYFISQGRTIASANKNAYKHLCKEYDTFEFESYKKDITDFLYTNYARWEGTKDSLEDPNSWTNRFPELRFIYPNKAMVVEISKDLYEEIMSNNDM